VTASWSPREGRLRWRSASQRRRARWRSIANRYAARNVQAMGASTGFPSDNWRQSRSNASWTTSSASSSLRPRRRAKPNRAWPLVAWMSSTIARLEPSCANPSPTGRMSTVAITPLRRRDGAKRCSQEERSWNQPDGTSSQPSRRARVASSVRELIPSRSNSRARCASTVRVVMPRTDAISSFVRPSRSVMTDRSRGVRLTSSCGLRSKARPLRSVSDAQCHMAHLIVAASSHPPDPFPKQTDIHVSVVGGDDHHHSTRVAAGQSSGRRTCVFRRRGGDTYRGGHDASHEPCLRDCDCRCAIGRCQRPAVDLGRGW
jgi:hypothetical protein